MKTDIEADFWKDVFVHMQHKNMVSTTSGPLSISDCNAVFKSFQEKHKDLKIEITNAASYITWETFISDEIKLRLFIQNGIKATLLQKNNGDLIKIADAKFPYNPFPQIEELFETREKLLQKLEEEKKDSVYKNRQLLIAMEFIKAYAAQKFDAIPDVLWKLDFEGSSIILILQHGRDEKRIPLTIKNFKSEIDSISL